MKAFRGKDGVIRMFRPMENMKRLSDSAVALSLPVSPLSKVSGSASSSEL